MGDPFLPCCEGRTTHGGAGCVWPGERTYTLDEYAAVVDAPARLRGET